MDTHFCAFHIASALTQRPHTQHHQHHQSGGMGSAKTCEGARTMSMVLALHAPQSQWGGMEQTEGALTPLCHGILHHKCKNHVGVARQCFGTSWQHCGQSGAYLHPISNTPTPRESYETPWGVSMYLMDCGQRNAGAACLF